MTGTQSRAVRPQCEELEGREVPAILFGMTAANQLVVFDSVNPDVVLRAIPLSGFAAANEVITDIDVRPATGGLYGHSNLGRIYLINPLSGFMIPIGNANPLSAANLGFDFDPKADRIRILSNKGENVVFEPSLGALVNTGTPLSYALGDRSQGAAPRITGSAFFNDVPNATFRSLFAIDHVENALVHVGQASLNDGILTTIGRLGFDVTNRVGFDIAPISNVAFASLQNSAEGFSRLYWLNYGNGHATEIGRIGRGILLNDIAVDLRGTSGFNSPAGFGIFPPPPPLFGVGVNTGTTTMGFGAFGSPSLISPFGSPITTTNIFPTLTQPLAGTLTTPLFMGGTSLTSNVFPSLSQPLSGPLSTPLFTSLTGTTTGTTIF